LNLLNWSRPPGEKFHRLAMVKNGIVIQRLQAGSISTLLFVFLVTISNAGLMPATQIKVSGYSGMALAHSRGTSCAAPRCVPRITIVVIRSAPNAAMSQARTS